MLWCLPIAFKPPKLPCQTSNPPCPSKPLIGYVTALLSPSYSVASCRWRLEAVPCWNIYLLVGISLYCYVILMHLYTWLRVEGSASRLVFCSTLAALVSVISVLCSRILRSLRGWVIMGTPWQFALNKTPPAMPNIVFTICHLSLFPWVPWTQVSSLF